MNPQRNKATALPGFNSLSLRSVRLPGDSGQGQDRRLPVDIMSYYHSDTTFSAVPPY